jgi:hypothetical protein
MTYSISYILTGILFALYESSITKKPRFKKYYSLIILLWPLYLTLQITYYASKK